MCPSKDVLGYRPILRKHDICEVFDEYELKEHCQNKNKEILGLFIILNDI